jgi:type IV pilus assembly protein PilM
MAKRLSSVLGIDVGCQQIKIAEVKMQGREPSITALAIGDTPPNAADHTGVYEVDEVASKIKELIQQSGASSPFAVISIAGQASVLVRTLEVPKMNPKELGEHMQWEITRNVPFAESTVVHDFKAYEPADAASQNLDVVMAISPQSAIDALISIVQKSGKKPAAIDVEPLGIARSQATSYTQHNANDTVCVVDIGHLSTSINMFKNNQLLMPRVVPIGGFQFTQAIAATMGMPEDSAEQAKQTQCVIPDDAGILPTADPFGATSSYEAYNPFPTPPSDPSVPSAPSVTPYSASGDEPVPYSPYSAADEVSADNPYAAAYADPTPPADDVPPPPPAADTPAFIAPAPVPTSSGDVRYYNAIAPILDEFLSEVRRSVDYFKSKGGEVDTILLCGGGSKLKGLDSFLTRTLGINVLMHDPLRNMAVNAKRLETGILEKHRAEFAVAVGNALHICFD